MDEGFDLRQRFHDHRNGTFTIETYQDVGPYLERNRRERNAWNGQGRQLVGDSMRKIADIPNVVAEKWMREYGVNVLDKNHLPAVKRLLRDPEWAYLRTSPGRI